ncbi:superoxide dismutase family protein [Aquimarina sp. 2201CG5-10]|uniref:superoxide dismutase family protein n=1 Tax=Aquimarina callyspongiae TaxID=3098150 RepID=UPI002AB3CAC6|nr:superoxide dismutase family protein [Aquimarina sp. 2201CG5-10]MDY8137025.1 superoxide dismutase family protein [Aquimarina sp. 2201CG5-10]
MKKQVRILVFISFFLVIQTSCNNDDDAPNTVRATVQLSEKNDSGLSGTVIFTETNGVVSMTATISNISEGNHAIHIHEIGDCSAADGTSAGGHWNPTNVSHGAWGTAPFHIGDIGNIVVNSNGNGSISRETNLWCIGCDDETKNIVGKAIIVHAGPDDFSSQPSGAAGARIGCGEIAKD